MAALRYTLDGEPVDLEDFLRDNADTFEPEELAALRAMQPGEHATFGGGACPRVTLRCLPEPRAAKNEPSVQYVRRRATG